MIDLGDGPVWALGLMSGTSLDGVDAALLKTDGAEIQAFGPSRGFDYGAHELGDVRAVMAAPLSHRETATLAAAEAQVAEAHAAAVARLLSGADQSPALIGFHGQTVFHAPDEGWTWQLGDGAVLARALNRPVVWDFRSDDMKAGGQGAPLAPFYHWALARHIGAAEPVAFLNIGGVANVTWVDPMAEAPEAEGALIAFDTGPGNALINDWMSAQTGEIMDRDGAAAAAGRADSSVLERNNFGSAYLERKPPKSLDRNDFTAALAAVQGMSAEDGAATLTALTVDCIARSLEWAPSPPARWLVCGGGRKSATMMRWLAERLGAPVDQVEAVGLDGDMLEAQAFAYLAVRVAKGLPTSAPGTTGCRAPVSGGRFSFPQP